MSTRGTTQAQTGRERPERVTPTSPNATSKVKESQPDTQARDYHLPGGQTIRVRLESDQNERTGRDEASHYSVARLNAAGRREGEETFAFTHADVEQALAQHGVANAFHGVGRADRNADFSANRREHARSGAELAQQLFGHALSSREMGALVGARTGDQVEASVIRHTGGANGRDELQLMFHGANGEDAVRQLAQDSRTGQLVMYNKTIEVPKSEQGKGAGAEIFARQVVGLARAGVARIETEAAGKDQGSKFNGASTWAKLGYDAPIPHALVTRNPDITRVAPNGSIRELLRAPSVRDQAGDRMTGAQFWQKYGDQYTWKGSFDLARGSQSRQDLEAYLRSKGRSDLADAVRDA